MKFMAAVSPIFDKSVDLEEYVKKALRYGFDGVELGLDGMVWPEKLKTVSFLKKIPVGVHLPWNFSIVEDENSQYGVFETFEKPRLFLPAMEEYLDFARKINARYVVYHPTMDLMTNAVPTEKTLLEVLSITKTLVNEMHKLCRKREITLCVENIIPYFTEQVAVMKELLSATPKAKICFDIAFNMLDDTAFARVPTWRQWLNLFKNKIFVVHYSDITKLSKLEITHHMKLKTSKFDFKDFFSTLKYVKPEFITSEEIYSKLASKIHKKVTWEQRRESLNLVKKWTS